MRDRSEIDRPALEALVQVLEAKAHGLRECLGALQLARSPEIERATVNRAIGLLERMKMHLRSGRKVVDLSEDWTRAASLNADAADAEARLKYGALALLEAQIQTLAAAGIKVVSEFDQDRAA